MNIDFSVAQQLADCGMARIAVSPRLDDCRELVRQYIGCLNTLQRDFDLNPERMVILRRSVSDAFSVRRDELCFRSAGPPRTAPFLSPPRPPGREEVVEC